MLALRECHPVLLCMAHLLSEPSSVEYVGVAADVEIWVGAEAAAGHGGAVGAAPAGAAGGLPLKKMKKKMKKKKAKLPSGLAAGPAAGLPGGGVAKVRARLSHLSCWCI